MNGMSVKREPSLSKAESALVVQTRGSSGQSEPLDSNPSESLASHQDTRPVVPAEKKLKFVVQKHRKPKLHYDLRLELDDMMHSWAVPRGPTLRAGGEPRLAVQVPVHAMSTYDQEGGDYLIWDRGTYSCTQLQRETERPVSPTREIVTEDHVEKLRKQLSEGKLGLTFFGQRMRGEFALVRTGMNSNKRRQLWNWLLIKGKDQYSVSQFDINSPDMCTSVLTGRTSEQIAEQASGFRQQRLEFAGRPQDPPCDKSNKMLVSPGSAGLLTQPNAQSPAKSESQESKASSNAAQPLVSDSAQFFVLDHDGEVEDDAAWDEGELQAAIAAVKPKASPKRGSPARHSSARDVIVIEPNAEDSSPPRTGSGKRDLAQMMAGSQTETSPSKRRKSEAAAQFFVPRASYPSSNNGNCNAGSTGVNQTAAGAREVIDLT